MFADGHATTIFAMCFDTPMLTQIGAAARFATRPPTIVLAYRRLVDTSSYPWFALQYHRSGLGAGNGRYRDTRDRIAVLVHLVLVLRGSTGDRPP